MIVGGYAVAFHGYPRFTKDIDIFYKASNENIKKLKQVLLNFEFADLELSEDLFVEQGDIIQFGISLVRIDLLNEIDGVAFDDAEAGIIRGR